MLSMIEVYNKSHTRSSVLADGYEHRLFRAFFSGKGMKIILEDALAPAGCRTEPLLML